MVAVSVITADSLTKQYGGRRGIDSVNLKVQAGEVFGFLGPNGAGKSTTIRLLLGFLRASSGDARIFGQDCWKNSAKIKRDVGYVAGDVRLYPWLTTRKAATIVGEIRGIDLHKPVMELAERFRLEPDLPVRKMSRGNRQKVALVMALAHRPKLIILDEPTSGLDPLMQDTLCEHLRTLALEGHTVFFSSHTLSEVDTLCNRVAIVRGGQIVADEALETMKARAPRTVVVSFANAEQAQRVEVPEIWNVQRRTQRTIVIDLLGPAKQLAEWAAAQSISDLSIGAPNLDTLFRQFYDDRPQSKASA